MFSCSAFLVRFDRSDEGLIHTIESNSKRLTDPASDYWRKRNPLTIENKTWIIYRVYAQKEKQSLVCPEIGTGLSSLTHKLNERLKLDG